MNDDWTMASHLQRMVGQTFQVVNAGVGGFEGEQALQMAIRAAKKANYEALIYVACQNDFMVQEGVPYGAQARQLLRKFAAAKGQFGGEVIVLLEPLAEYAINDILQRGGWYREMVVEMDRLREDMPAATKEHGFAFVDGTTIINDYAAQSGTIMARFALYVDNAHLSPLGNRLAAQRLYEELQRTGLMR